MAVVQYNGSAVGDGRPGPVSRRLRELLQQDLLENGTPL
jgi:branched-chain amino acid aminotransferase